MTPAFEPEPPPIQRVRPAQRPRRKIGFNPLYVAAASIIAVVLLISGYRFSQGFLQPAVNAKPSSRIPIPERDFVEVNPVSDDDSPAPSVKAVAKSDEPPPSIPQELEPDKSSVLSGLENVRDEANPEVPVAEKPVVAEVEPTPETPETTAALTAAEETPVDAREKANMEKFAAEREKLEARAAAKAAAHANFEAAVAEKEARVKAKQKMIAEKQYNIKKYGQPTKPLTTKERAKLMLNKRNEKASTKP